MSMTDPIADMFTRIRNAQMVGRKTVSMPASKLKKAIAELLLREGYIRSLDVAGGEAGKPSLVIELKYFDGKPAIERIERVSRPGLRVYRGRNDLPKVIGGLGVSIVSTSAGLLSDAEARGKGLGGEVIGLVA